MNQDKKSNRKDSKGRVLRKGESQRKDGTYMFRYTDECKIRRSVYAQNLNDLRKKEDTIELNRLDNIRYTSKRYNVQTMVSKYLSLKQNCSKSTIVRYETAYKHIEGSWFGLLPMKEVIKSQVIRFYNELALKMTNAGIIKINTILFPAFELAVSDGLIRVNPAKDMVKLFPCDTEEKEPLSEKEVSNLLDYIQQHTCYKKFYPLVVMMLETMLRGSELCGLTWDDVDFEERIIKIDHQLLYQKCKGDNKAKFYIDTPKTKNSIREIPLTKKAYDALRMQQKFLLSTNRLPTVEIDGYKNFIFLTRNGKPYNYRQLNNVNARIVKSYNKKHKDEPLPKITNHTYRHTGCARFSKIFYKNGIDIKILQNWMGHASLRTTLDIYNHANKEDIKNAVENIDLFTA